jgi:peroxiredoxin Q/BCP
MLFNRVLRAGKRMPDVAALADGGKTVRLRDLVRDKPLLLVFVRCTYCTGCMAYAKHLKEWTARLKDAGLSVALCLTEGWRAVHEWARADEMPMIVLADESREASKEFGVYKALGFDSLRHARPSAFMIDRSGTVRWSTIFPDEEDKAPKLEDYLKVAATHLSLA